MFSSAQARLHLRLPRQSHWRSQRLAMQDKFPSPHQCSLQIRAGLCWFRESLSFYCTYKVKAFCLCMTKSVHFKSLCKQDELELNAIMWENSDEDISEKISLSKYNRKKKISTTTKKKQHLKVKFCSYRVAVRSYYMRKTTTTVLLLRL